MQTRFDFAPTDKHWPIDLWVIGAAVKDFSDIFVNDSLGRNEGRGCWDESEVATFSDMFQLSFVTNQNIRFWDVSKGRDFSRMFQGALLSNLAGWTSAFAERYIFLPHV